MKFMMDAFKRAFDVGIAEQHASPLSTRMAARMIVFCNIYSTFVSLRPSLHDVAYRILPFFFCLDRAGLVG
jgi:1-deoxy-D-xylulose-5-phosphate synthase